nr:immunoglobulin heavy chain junction region [Mus musculus]
CARSNYAFDSW